MLCPWRTLERWLLLILTVFLVPGCRCAGVGSSGTPGNLTQQQMVKNNYSMASTHSSSVKGEERRLTPPVEANTSLSVPVSTKVVLLCPGDSKAVVVTWIIFGDKSFCTRAYRRDINETSEKNCTDERISWESRPDQNPALRIDPVATIHDGYYRCEVAAPDGYFNLGYFIHVSAPPEVTLYRSSSGTTVCTAAAGKPAAEIFWNPRGDCDTVGQQLANGTVTVQSTCHWEGRQVSMVSCFVSHVTGNKSLSLDLKSGDQSSRNLSILWIIFPILVISVIIGSICLWKTGCCRKCKLKKTEAISVAEEEEMQPYASYTEKNNPLYDTVSK